LDETLSKMAMMDAVRAKWGLRYPNEHITAPSRTHFATARDQPVYRRSFTDPQVAQLHFNLLAEVNRLLAISPKPVFFNFSKVCQLVESSISSVNLDGVMKAGFLHWDDVHTAAFVSSEEFLHAWVQGMNHFLGAWAMEHTPVEALTLFSTGEFSEAVHGALTLWGAQHSRMTPSDFWDVANAELSVLSSDSHSLGHAAFMHATYAVMEVKPVLSSCLFPSNYLRGYLSEAPGPIIQTAIEICERAPANLTALSCAFGVFHSARSYLTLWYASCASVCEGIHTFHAPCYFHCTHDWSNLNYQMFYANTNFDVRSSWYTSS